MGANRERRAVSPPHGRFGFPKVWSGLSALMLWFNPGPWGFGPRLVWFAPSALGAVGKVSEIIPRKDF